MTDQKNKCCFKVKKLEIQKSVTFIMLRTPGDFGKVICSAKNIAGEGKTCIYIIKQRVLNHALVTKLFCNLLFQFALQVGYSVTYFFRPPVLYAKYGGHG